MSCLSKLLIFKIAFTVVFACIPLLFLPIGVLRDLGFEAPSPSLFLRLLGMAYLALVMDYGFGLRDSLQGRYPCSTVWVGIVSNGGAALLLGLSGVKGVWENWGLVAQVSMWASVICLWGITLGLITLGPWALQTGRPRSADLVSPL